MWELGFRDVLQHKQCQVILAFWIAFDRDFSTVRNSMIAIN